jgi:putative membrane-bound dehydrogenase-like protein
MRAFRCLALTFAASMAAPAARAADAAPLEVLDGDLKVDLLASEPDIVTPVALDVDALARIWVIESHTHFPKPDYAGPKSDRILRFEDADRDDRLDAPVVFAEGFKHLMGLELRDPRSVFAATRREVFLLSDADGDGRADETRSLARLETRGDYPHNGLSGFAIDDLGWLYFGLGENLGETYRVAAADGSGVSGGGEGGSIYRMRPDGSRLSRWSTGFWNPFHLEFDAYGNLFAVDNDPDSRPPCRLIHAVRGGDYGYRFWLGRSGLHPYTSWNGELPGTLPMAAGTGEAPSGIVLYEHSSLPERYRGGFFVSSWGDHRIEFYRLTARGASFASSPVPVARGGEMFRPVGIALAPDGSLVFSDWVDKDYHVHRKGRIWRLSIQGAPRTPRPWPRPVVEESGVGGKIDLLSHPSLEVRRWAIEALVEAGDAAVAALRSLVAGAASDVARYGALVALARIGALDRAALDAAIAATASPDLAAAAVRLLGELGKLESADLPALRPKLPAPALREAVLQVPDAGALPKALLQSLLAHPDPFIAGAALAAIERSRVRPELAAWLDEDKPELRLAALLAMRRLGDPSQLARLVADRDPAVLRAAVQWAGEERRREHRAAIEALLAADAVAEEVLDAALAAVHLLDGGNPTERDREDRDASLLKLAADSRKPARLRRSALRAVTPAFEGLTLERLQRFLQEDDLDLRREALRTLRERADGPERIRGVLRGVLDDAAAPAPLRREALIGLWRFLDEDKAAFAARLDDADAALRREAARCLRDVVELPEEARRKRDALLEPTLQAAGLDARSSELRAAILERPPPGDAAEGELIFFHPKGPGCARCHSIGGRGGAVGPDLSTIGQRPREHLFESLMEPSKEIAPQFAAWLIATRDGILSGIILGEHADGSITLGLADGSHRRLAREDVVQRTLLDISIMPENLLEGLSARELKHLLVFLKSLK